MSKSNKGKGIVVVLVVVLVGSAGFVGWLWGNDWFFSTKPKGLTPELDGVYEEREWKRASYFNIPFYLDVDNDIDPVVSKANVDGWNYFSVAEDDDYYYVGIDLCSDRTNNPDGEWVGLGLTTRMPDVFNAKLGFYALENYGFEYLMYNVSADQVFDYELDQGFGTGTFYDVPFVPEYDEMYLEAGEIEGDYLDFWYFDDGKDLILKSEFVNDTIWNHGEFVVLEFGINVTEKFPTLNATDYLPLVYDFDLVMHWTGNLTANNPQDAIYAEKIWLVVAEHGGTYMELNNSQFIDYQFAESFTNGTYTSTTFELDHNKINATNGMAYFSIFGWNGVNSTDPIAFELYIDQLEVKMSTSQNIATTLGTSLESGNYEVAYAYGSSHNCADDHRMFEIKVAKSEFPVLSDDMLYLNLAGYGTMAIEGTNYWVHPLKEITISASPVEQFYDDDVDFLAFDMSIT